MKLILNCKIKDGHYIGEGSDKVFYTLWSVSLLNSLNGWYIYSAEYIKNITLIAEGLEKAQEKVTATYCSLLNYGQKYEYEHKEYIIEESTATAKIFHQKWLEERQIQLQHIINKLRISYIDQWAKPVYRDKNSFEMGLANSLQYFGYVSFKQADSICQIVIGRQSKKINEIWWELHDLLTYSWKQYKLDNHISF